jgi:hypothetical protein
MPSNASSGSGDPVCGSCDLPAFWSAGAAADWSAVVVVDDWVAFWSVVVVDDVAFCPAVVLEVADVAFWSAGFCSVATAFESGAG